MKLVIFAQDGARKDIPVKPGTYVVGRNQNAAIRVPLPSVSRSHAELIVTDDGARIRDLGSANGTFQNYERVEQAELKAGDVLGIGEMLMTIQINGQPEHIQRPASQQTHTHAAPDDQTQVTPPKAAQPPITANSGDSSMMEEDLGFAPPSSNALEDSSGEAFDLSFLDDDDDDNPQL